MAEPNVSGEARGRIQRVLAMLESDLTRELAPWYVGSTALAAQVTESGVGRFEQKFDRWRDLLSAAERQKEAARRTLDDYSAPAQEKRAAKTRHDQALDQINLLQQGTNSLSSDFYTYRYLATEGFLPGYNFPRLPLMAYIPATSDGRGRQAYLQRPRFLALAEFGPNSLVYHEGRAYRVRRALLALNHQGAATAEKLLPTQSVRICKSCGAGHLDDEVSMCHACGLPLGDAEIVRDVYRIENVATQPAERITANDEERKRQGFDLQTTFEWAVRDQTVDVRHGLASDEDGEVARLAYGPGATITRLNKGLRRRANRTQLGFLIDPVSGYWEKSEEDSDEGTDPTAAPRQRIVPCVRDNKNALLLQPASRELPQTTYATVQHALLRGLEAVFQLEQGELLAEPMPTRDARTGVLFYEATEGGAGVLTRLVAEPDRLAEVARQALAIMHFDVASSLPDDEASLKDVPGTSCVAACYRCLMSYYNQPDHELLDRRNEGARALLLRLARCSSTGLQAARPHNGPDNTPRVEEGGSIARWIELAQAHHVPLPDPEPLVAGSTRVPLIWRAHYVLALLEEPGAASRQQLEDKGFDLVVFGPAEPAWEDGFKRLAKLLGRTP
jgi:hypothetical protein